MPEAYWAISIQGNATGWFRDREGCPGGKLERRSATSDTRGMWLWSRLLTAGGADRERYPCMEGY